MGVERSRGSRDALPPRLCILGRLADVGDDPTASPEARGISKMWDNVSRGGGAAILGRLYTLKRKCLPSPHHVRSVEWAARDRGSGQGRLDGVSPEVHRSQSTPYPIVGV
ncbi:hypothetical protein Sjap_020663 [Stephania japonica]|uniref:Uncharacterized protein n=1 Tax=Stephania japonica TaxID=461633 RepID=A0AAP0I0V0_9MAGN